MTSERSAIRDPRSATSGRANALSATLAVSHRHRAFTIIELMVVVGIIVLLVGLTVSVSVILHQKSETRQVEQMLKLLDMAMQEWELAAERQMSWGPTGTTAPGGQVLYFDIHSDPTPPSGKTAAYQMKEILAKLNQNTSAREILARIDSKFFREEADPDAGADQKRFVLRDPWGQTIVPVHPGRLPNPSPPFNDPTAPDPCLIDTDGTIRTGEGVTGASDDVNENRLGICANRRILFISRGPDGELGNLFLKKALSDLTASEQQDFKLAGDNIYSYTPLTTRNCP